MSRENVEVVRQPITVTAHTRRRLEERLVLRFPHTSAYLTRLLWRLPASSRLRKAVIRRGVRLGFEAANRGDYEAAYAVYHPEIEFIVPPEVAGLGLDPVYRGREERIRFQQIWTAEWGEMRFEIQEVIDLGDRVLVIGRVSGSGLNSGVPIESQYGQLFTVSGSAGRVVRDQPFLDHKEALEAVGLRE